MSIILFTSYAREVLNNPHILADKGKHHWSEFLKLGLDLEKELNWLLYVYSLAYPTPSPFCNAVEIGVDRFEAYLSVRHR